MVRQKLKELDWPKEGEFRLRGKDHTRIEGLSDGVFAIAIALLLISSDIPETFIELKAFMYEFVPFAATIAILMMLWHQHYIFFIRYGLRDTRTVFYNTVLLFLILFYVYPLKFLFKTLFTLFSGIATGNEQMLRHLFTEIITLEDTRSLMIIYGLGAMSIFLIFALLFNLAYRRRAQLDLNEIESFLTKSSIYTNLVSAAIPLLSALIALSGVGGPRNFQWAGFIYWIYPIAIPLYFSMYHSRRLKALKNKGEELTT